MKSYLPIVIKYSPIRRLALVPFEKDRDIIYKGFELQFIDGEPYGVGYRVLAYRNDKYLDVYDDVSLNYMEDEKFNVAENGLHQHVRTNINNVRLYKVDNNQIISFEFVDIQGRKVSVHIEEKTKRKTKSMNLLAPIGVGSKKPDYLPVFFMYDFDFMRRSKTLVSCNIDGKKIQLDKFPFHMNGQARWYVRYSNECELLEFANTDATVLKEIELDEENVYCEENVKYIYESENVLKKIVVYFGEHDVQINFHSGMNLIKSCSGTFTIVPRQQMGYLQGEYIVRVGQNTEITILPKSGWISNPNSFLTKLILGKKSVFCNWSKKYKYYSRIDLEKKEVDSSWKNENLKEE